MWLYDYICCSSLLIQKDCGRQVCVEKTTSALAFNADNVAVGHRFYLAGFATSQDTSGVLESERDFSARLLLYEVTCYLNETSIFYYIDSFPICGVCICLVSPNFREV